MNSDILNHSKIDVWFDLIKFSEINLNGLATSYCYDVYKIAFSKFDRWFLQWFSIAYSRSVNDLLNILCLCLSLSPDLYVIPCFCFFFFLSFAHLIKEWFSTMGSEQFSNQKSVHLIEIGSLIHWQINFWKTIWIESTSSILGTVVSIQAFTHQIYAMGEQRIDEYAVCIVVVFGQRNEMIPFF